MTKNIFTSKMKMVSNVIFSVHFINVYCWLSTKPYSVYVADFPDFDNFRYFLVKLTSWQPPGQRHRFEKSIM